MEGRGEVTGAADRGGGGGRGGCTAGPESLHTG